MSQKKERFNLSAPLYKPEGNVVGALYMQGILDCLLIREEYSGYPYNGSRHTLILFLTRDDLEAFFDLIQPHFDDVPHNRYKNGVNILREMVNRV